MSRLTQLDFKYSHKILKYLMLDVVLYYITSELPLMKTLIYMWYVCERTSEQRERKGENI